MQSFVNDFGIFFGAIFNCIKSFWNWFISTTMGEIILYTILISIFFLIVNLIVNFKD